MNDNLDMMESYSKWKAIRCKEKATFNLFCFTEKSDEYILEVPTATIIQCMEGYFKCHHDEMMMKFKSEVKEEILNIIEEKLNSSDKLLNICEINEIDSNTIR